MKDYIQRKVAEFKEIQKESFMTATAKPLLLQPEAVVWYEEILKESIHQAIAEERERVREYLNHYKTKSYCCSQTVDDIYTKYTKVMNDSKPFKHGEEGTHNVCNKHNIGGKSVCCECSGKDDCGDEPMKPSEIFEGENSGLRNAFREAVAREQSLIDQGKAGIGRNLTSMNNGMVFNPNNMTNKDWKEQFKQEFGIHFSDSEFGFAISFIESLLKSKQGEIEKKIEEWNPIQWNEQCLAEMKQDLKPIITNLLK